MNTKASLLFLLFIHSGCYLLAQSSKDAGLSLIDRETAEAFVSFLASDELEGREAGSRGGHIAGVYLVSCLKQMGLAPLEDSYYQPFEAYSRERQKKQRFQVEPDSIDVIKQETVYRILAMRNVLAKIEGMRKNEYVVIGAHYDHLGIDPDLVGDQIYNGADDNASGVSAVLQIARAFIASGVQPERTIVFAFWDGEEKGLLGSRYFTQNFSGMDQVKGYLNFDMIGRNNDESNPNQVVYFYTEAHPAFGDWLKNDVAKYKLSLVPSYRPWERPVSGSDNSSFARLDIPVIWYHTDGHPDYHMPSDHADKINWNKLVDITKAAYLNLWNLANEPAY
ncbi:MAG: M20/M25/M40 family metallo-hydrolase [Massilibacteroides sp.]|nr:M20/M25/M40 family metallo-hydrolase [Massilibacteroides sp.]MDD3061645.1 M20/M25/M40 family metallo-hydrolase [Massilibacteroides sp.]MDD4114312.1 M20/M25/M40 family metallo-hydrolase [Massilibacteroides sp.]MDD4659971.1 M20/M25/M40 family metallo-hydrolase [Massilibacteroides sp.]